MHFHLAVFYVCACFVAVNAYKTQLNNGVKDDFKTVFSSLNKVTFLEGVELCKRVNREIARIENSDDNDEVFRILITVSPTAQYWIGAQKNSTSGDWEWYETGKKLTYFDWGNGEPVQKDGYNCIKSDFEAYVNGKVWGTADCNEKRFVLCQLN